MKTLKYILYFMLSLISFNALAKQKPEQIFMISGTTLMNHDGTPQQFSYIYPGLSSTNLSQLNTTNRKTTFQNTITLILKNHSAFSENAKVTLTVELKYFPVNSSAPVLKSINLELDYKQGILTKTNVSEIYAFLNAYHVELTITNVTVSSDIGANINALKVKLEDFIELRVGFIEETITRMDYNLIVSDLTHCEDTKTDELVINWTALDDAEEYELEYTFVDDYTGIYNVLRQASTIPFSFKDNSTRIALKDNFYRVPLIFERGYILYRVRAIGRGGNNLELPVYCKWSGSADKMNVSQFTAANTFKHLIAHGNDKMNWQLASTFAEEGKRSDMVKYFDGTFRLRQTQSAMNLEPQLPTGQINNAPSCYVNLGTQKIREVIAGETIYDFQGRAAVNIMPAPTNAEKLGYLKNLNISEVSLKPYNWEDFDKAHYTCPPNVNKLKKIVTIGGIMGAAAYYSDINPNQLGFNAFIPDAKGFPFSQLSYLQDNTGRVAAQSGVGNTFQFGEDHETRNYYAAPNQEELDLMFGTSVGDAKRYKKNAVMDANRQVSVAYLNPEGKIIATSLAGNKPANLDKLSNQAQTAINVSLMNKNLLNMADNTSITEDIFIVTTDDTDYIFDYSINPEAIEDCKCNETPVCLDCIYDIDIILNHLESCSGAPLDKYTGTIGNLMNNSGSTDVNCDNNNPTEIYSRQIKKTLKIGTYSITKKVAVNKQAGHTYVDEVFKTKCVSKWNEILKTQLNLIDTLSCYKSCTTCAEPPVKTATCDTVYCAPKPNRCDNIKSMMLADVSPGGQYGQFDRNANGTIDASAYPLSVFNPSNLLPTSTINLNLFTPAFADYASLVNNWLPEYADKLLNMHPEFCMQGWCNTENTDTTLDYDMKILSTEHYAEAVAAALILPGSALPNNNTYGKLLANDPWFSNNQNANYRTTLLYKLQNYGCSGTMLPIDKLAMQMAYCASLPQPPHPVGSTPAMSTSQSCTGSPDPNYLANHFFGSGNTELDDLEWTFLRNLYLSAKNEVIQASMNAYADLNNCNSRCIGSNDYYDWGQFSNNNIGFAAQHNFMPCQSPFVWIYYKDKQNRFSTSISNILNSLANQGVSISTTSMTNYDDPCQYANAIASQASNINQQVENTFCGSTVSCTQPTAYMEGVKDYLNTIFQFTSANQVSPSPVQLLNWLPPTFMTGINGQAIAVTLNSNSIFTVKLDYLNSDQSCTIKLNNNWSNVKSILSIAPDMTLASNGITKGFILTALSGTTNSNLTTISINGTVSCWAMNQCSGSSTLCDAIPVMPPYPHINNCVSGLLANAYSNAELLYHTWETTAKADMLQRYYAKCMQAEESLNMQYNNSQYQYTLYYYDRAGNLVNTVPPAGVHLLNHTQATDAGNSRLEAYATPILPKHIKRTAYHYNTLNGLTWQKTPDAGESSFYYDRLGRISASQNAEQRTGSAFSYTRYDKTGRPVEAGQLKGILPQITSTLSIANYDAWTNYVNSQASRTQITLTKYDESFSVAISQKFTSGQQNLRKRVASAFNFKNATNLAIGNYTHATHYSYDIEGNINKLIQDYPNTLILDKTIDYDFDLQSGKVNKVTYQRGAMDQFIHRYNYDAANRLTQVETSSNGLVWETDAVYKYYRHGPIARVVLGTDKVQGLDYIYTLQGWIKGVNGTSSSPETDMGQDGVISIGTPSSQPNTAIINGVSYYVYTGAQLYGNNFNGPGYGGINNPVAADAFGYVLDYFGDDYKAISGNNCLAALPPISNSNQLYNGNIGRMYTQIQSLGNNGYNYKYDQLNRITSQNAWTLTGNLLAMRPGDGYGGTFSYDADGNIMNQARNGANSDMDKLDYFYYDDAGSIYNPTSTIPANATNRLAYVKDQVASGNYAEDIDTQNPNNYKYNSIGNLISDNAEHILSIDWNVQNKITNIIKSTGPNLSFQYDAMGNRVMKEVTSGNAAQNAKIFYVRDAQGNAMATYSYKITSTGVNAKLFWSEAGIYGSSRIGLYTPEIEMNTTPVATTDFSLNANRGNKQYELSNHLGNVLATISDRKVAVTGNAAITYTADILSGQDYYAFGMQMPERTITTGNYSYGFNGKENDNEVKGDGNQQDYGFRVYDPRVGKFLSIDPLTKDYPELTPYQFASNTPIMAIDLDGLEAVVPKNNVEVDYQKKTIKRTFNVVLYPGVGMTVASIAAAMVRPPSTANNRPAYTFVQSTANEGHEQRTTPGGGLFSGTRLLTGTDIINFEISPSRPPEPDPTKIYLAVNIGGPTAMQEKTVPYPTHAGNSTGFGLIGRWGSGDVNKGVVTQGIFTLNQGTISNANLATIFTPPPPAGSFTILNLIQYTLNNPKLFGNYSSALRDEQIYGTLYSNPVNDKDAKKGSPVKVRN